VGLCAVADRAPRVIGLVDMAPSGAALCCVGLMCSLTARRSLQAPLDVAKQVILFCADHWAQIAVDELMAEAAQLVREEPSGEGVGGSRQGSQSLDDFLSFQSHVSPKPCDPDSLTSNV
jgi:hypothetical protein